MATSLASGVIERLLRSHRDIRDSDVPPIPSDRVPTAVENALAPLGLRFGDLQRVLQHALLWRAGFMTTTEGSVLETRTRCGLSITASMELSTFAVPMCAVRGAAPNESTVWLRFHDSTVLPGTVAFSTTATQNADIVPCSTRDEDFNSFCQPEDANTLFEWLRTEMSPDVSVAASSTSVNGSPQSTEDEIVRAFANITTSQSAGPMGLASADFASVYYAFHTSGMTLHRIELSSDTPLDVTQRLDASQLKFKSITGFLQRALLWDTGYVIVPHRGSSTKLDVVPVYVKCGLRMADLALDRSYFDSTGCPVLDCSRRNASNDGAVRSYRSTACSSGGRGSIDTLSRCAVPADIEHGVTVPVAASSTIWAVGDIDTTNKTEIPHMWLQRLPLTSGRYAIHSATEEAPVGSCPSSPSFVIPCVTVDQSRLQEVWCRPIQSELVTTWLHEEEHQEMALSTLILLAGAILLALALDLFVDRKPRFFANGRVSVSIPSITSTVLDPNGEQSVTVHSDRTGSSSFRSVQSNR